MSGLVKYLYSCARWRVGVAELHACVRVRVQEGSGYNVKVWFPECSLFGDKNTLRKRFGAKDSVRCSEFRGGRFSEVANVLQVWDFKSVTRTLSALGSVSASRSVRSGRFYCIVLLAQNCAGYSSYVITALLYEPGRMP